MLSTISSGDHATLTGGADRASTNVATVEALVRRRVGLVGGTRTRNGSVLDVVHVQPDGDTDSVSLFIFDKAAVDEPNAIELLHLVLGDDVEIITGSAVVK